MGLVDYDSDSGLSDGEAVATTAAAKPAAGTAAAAGKKPFQKLVDRANPGKIVVSLPKADETSSSAADGDAEDGRPAKRAKVGVSGASRFSGFGSFLPPPKKTTAVSAGPAAVAEASASTSSRKSPSPSTLPRPGVHLKTSSEAAFRRSDEVLGGSGANDSSNNNAEDDGDSVRGRDAATKSSTLSLPPPKAPTIPADQKSAEDVKLVGNPLMFMPLSVSRKPGKKKVAGAGTLKAASAAPSTAVAVSTSTKKGQESSGSTGAAAAPAAPAPEKKKISLFSLGTDDQTHSAPSTAEGEEGTLERDQGAEYQPLFQEDYASGTHSYTTTANEYEYEQQQQQAQYVAAPAAASATSLGALADDLQLSAKERRELFGRKGAAAAHAQVAATFDMDREYRHNEALRLASELEPQQQAHNPVRAVQPGKHSLRQLVNAVHTQKDALEETFAKNRATQRESGGRYGWR